MDKQVEAHMDILRSNTFHFNPKNRKRKTEEELTFREIVADNFPQLAKSQNQESFPENKRQLHLGISQ